MLLIIFIILKVFYLNKIILNRFLIESNSDRFKLSFNYHKYIIRVINR